MKDEFDYAEERNPMGFLDDMQASFDRTAAGANRSIQTSGLNRQMDDALKRRQQLAAQLGASLYEVTKDNPELREGREGLYDRIAAVDAERAQIQAQLDDLKRQAEQAAYAAVTLSCPFCGSRVSQADAFCMGCGKPMAEIQAEIARRQQAAQAQAAAAQAAAQQAAYAQAPAQAQQAAGAVAGGPAGTDAAEAAAGGPTCPSCGAPIKEGDAFCMNCGQKLG